MWVHICKQAQPTRLYFDQLSLLQVMLYINEYAFLFSKCFVLKIFDNFFFSSKTCLYRSNLYFGCIARRCMPAFVGVIFVWNNFAGAQQSMIFIPNTIPDSSILYFSQWLSRHKSFHQIFPILIEMVGVFLQLRTYLEKSW